MKGLIPSLGDEVREEEAIVVATLVSATGTSSKKVGARMYVGASGRLIGGVTIGGCVDAQVVEAADALIDEGGRKLLSISLDDDEAWEIGLTCGGNVEVLVECITPSDASDPAVASSAAARRAIAADRGAVVATTLDGARRSLVIDENGDRAGTLGDAATDAEAASIAADVLRAGSRVEMVDGQRVFFDRHAPPTVLVIVGAGQIAMSLTHFARELEMRTVVVDGRERYATRERFPAADDIRVGMPSEIVAELAPGKRAAVILVSHDYKYELPVLRSLVRSNVGYLGMLGSKTRGAAVRAMLRDEGFMDDELSRIRTPIGLDIGGKSSAEVALSILIYQRSGSPLLSALVLTASFLPYGLGGTVLSSVADRFPARRVLVACETRLIGCDLEQHPTPGAEIDREEVVAVDHRRELVTRIHQRLAHRQLVRLGRNREGDMVHRSGAEAGERSTRQCLEIDEIGTVAATPHQPLDAAMRLGDLVAHEFEQLFRCPFVAQPQGGRMEATDRLVGRNAAMCPWQASIVLVFD